MRMARPGYTTWTVRRRPLLRRSKSITSGVRLAGVRRPDRDQLSGGALGVTTVCELEQHDADQEEDYEGGGLQSSCAWVRPRHSRRDDGDDDRSVAPVTGQGAAIDDAPRAQAHQGQRQLEGETDRAHGKDRERIQGRGLDEIVELVVVGVL